MPRISRRLAAGPLDQAATPQADSGRPDWSAPARGRRTATGIAEQSVTALDAGDDEAAAQLVGVGELLDAVAQTSPAATRTELAAAARSFERATRSHIRAEQADTRAIRSAARGIIQAGGALGRGEDGGATAMLLSTLVLVAIAAVRWHSARGHAQQAAASRQTAEHLRAAYRQAAAAPMQALRDHGRALPEAQRRTYETTIRTALPDNSGPTGRAANTDALAATLAQAERAGHDPKSLLQKAIDMRELDTAENVNDVLVWRLRRLANLPAHPGSPSRSPQAGTGRTKTAAHRTVLPTAHRQAETDPRNRTPRR